MKKKIIIFRHNGGQLGNQLWNFISVYAYCLEKGYECRNYSFFGYGKFFNISPGNVFIKIIFFNRLKGIFSKIKSELYSYYTNFIKKYKHQLIFSDNEIDTFYLPPTANTNPEQLKLIKRLGTENYKKAYFQGWLFRNPVGIEKYRKEIIKYFEPKKHIIEKVTGNIALLREKYKHIVGVHIRQGVYRTFYDGKYFFEQDAIKKILEDYLRFYDRKKSDTLFLICSDEKIDSEKFRGLNIKLNGGNLIEDLYTLSKTDIIIGSNSTFGAFSAYYGNIPIAVFERNGINWQEIPIDKGYNYKNGCTLVHQ